MVRLPVHVSFSITCIAHHLAEAPVLGSKSKAPVSVSVSNDRLEALHPKRLPQADLADPSMRSCMFVRLEQEAGCEVHMSGSLPFDCNAAINNFFRVAWPVLTDAPNVRGLWECRRQSSRLPCHGRAL